MNVHETIDCFLAPFIARVRPHAAAHRHTGCSKAATSHPQGRVLANFFCGLVMALAVLTAPPANAALEQLHAAGIGAQAQFNAIESIDNRVVRTAVTVFTGVPDGGAPQLGVVLMQTDEAGQVLFSGFGTVPGASLQLGAPYDWAHVQGTLQVLEASGSAQRMVQLNVVWHASAAEQSAPAKGDGGMVRKEQHQGTLRAAVATGVVQVSDPAVSGHVLSLTQAEAPAVQWNTTSSGVLSTKGAAPRQAPTSGTALQAATAACSGYWTGFWTWVSDPAPAHWFWTWVWYSGCNGYVVS